MTGDAVGSNNRQLGSTRLHRRGAAATPQAGVVTSGAVSK
eukprot:CAMPEP_0183365942 /NCGR_PEP_ID=MMETSP0164_2-20130417/86706_1 /TAXON_ID=221442 /ORGANISM="Coccolithus pelagicus ssp braarudi, Strain PLY182g" /LENGTH=39 /DNA_ID= /DNA_START= /DNA_END= /DNA_ORIENTATION=